MIQVRLNQAQQGAGLVEILVALLLLAIAVLGFGAMQITAVKATDESVIRSRALTVMRGGAEMMRANPEGIAEFEKALKNGNYPGITKDSCTDINKPCTINQLAARDALALKEFADSNDVRIEMGDCVGTKTTGLPIKCLTASWGDTAPIYDNSADKTTYKGIKDLTPCAKANGEYHPGARCFIMEAY
ncbi:putative type IV fimbrial biogenesis protein PilV [Moraxella macacae 0408225]|uniref:Putative type IV fimbrial biogenesis protein PilV n=1 Tax=Moraxella macacae 0408225 TaxID=1230338 RepID=L2F9R7_9GAMM|nr:type IV pilus modification protein PilV [Moraxella macacae]ELA09782.1 putative type IV fimbrial biogenesis protein PilV [Moraxella macacae 0408225]